MPDVEAIAESKRYVLAEEDDAYRIWDLDNPDQPLEEFPLTDDGFEEGWERFHQLRRLEQEKGGILARGLWIALILGVTAWLGGVLVYAAFYAIRPTDVPENVLSIAGAFDVVGFRVTQATVFILVALVAFRWERATRGVAPSVVGDVGQSVGSAPDDGIDLLLRRTLIAGLLVWTAAAAVTAYNTPRGFPSEETERFVLWTTLAESVAFRVWVSAAAILLARWIARRGEMSDPRAANGGNDRRPRTPPAEPSGRRAR